MAMAIQTGPDGHGDPDGRELGHGHLGCTAIGEGDGKARGGGGRCEYRGEQGGDC